MTSTSPDFVKPESLDKKPNLSLHAVRPVINKVVDTNPVLTTNIVRSIRQCDDLQFAEDGLYISSQHPLNRQVIKPELKMSGSKVTDRIPRHPSGKLLEVAIRDILIRSEENCEESTLEITSASVMFRKKAICQEQQPFNRKLYKFLIRKPSDSNDFSIRVVAQDGSAVSVPLPFPKHNVRNKQLETDFAISDNSGKVYSGLLVCTVSVVTREPESQETLGHQYTPSNDPNNPQKIVSMFRWRSEVDLEPKKYFHLLDQALTLPGPLPKARRAPKKKLTKPLEIAVVEQSFSLMSLPIFQYLQCQEQPPAKPVNSITSGPKGKQVLIVTILRGIEVPVREESALVQPVVEVEWCNIVHMTSVADGPAPVWQQTIQFKVSRLTGEQYVKLRLFDQHPIWGLQWLGETIIPLECLSYYQEVERWIGLSPLRSPRHLLGYVQASPGYSYTRLYVLMKMHHVGTVGTVDEGSLEALSKAIQKCISVPYKIEELQDPQEVAKLVTLLTSLPTHYGPLKPRQALNLNKVDSYGRAALLTALFQGLGLQTYVLLGSSQISKLTAYCLTTDPSQNTYLWDLESGDYYNLNDSRCSLTTVFRLIDPKTVWDNTLKSMAPSTLKYNPETNRDWQALSINSAISESQLQILHLNFDKSNDQQIALEIEEMEQKLKDCLVQWREALELQTIFNDHAETILRSSLSKNSGLSSRSQFDKKKLRQLYRVFYIHGFIINLHYTKLDELLNLVLSTKSHMITGPVEFALACHIETYIESIRSIWLGLLILRSRE